MQQFSNRLKHWQIFLPLVLAVLLSFTLTSGRVGAAGKTIRVTSTGGGTGGPQCTLRDAILAVDTSSLYGACDGSGTGPFTIELVANEVYNVTEVVDTNLSGYPAGLPVISSDLTINGNGATIRGSAGSPPLSLLTIYLATVTVNNVTLQSSSTVGYGGGGGAIYNYNGTLNLNYSTISGNVAGSGGGGVYNGGTATITYSTFSNNSAQQGGAIHNAGTLTVLNSTFDTNQSTAGGAIYSQGPLAMTNSTLANNEALKGGALYVADGATTLVNTTIAHNRSTGPGSGVWKDAGTLTLKNTLVAGNGTGLQCGDFEILGASNMSDDDTCGDTFRLVSLDMLKLGELADNGGPTQTVALDPKSSAVDAGDNDICAAAVGAPDYGAGARDQRDFTRPQGTRCDIGALEVAVTPPPPPVNPPGKLPPNPPETVPGGPPTNPPETVPGGPPTNPPTNPPGKLPSNPPGKLPTNPPDKVPKTPPDTTPKKIVCTNPYIVQRNEWLYQIARKCGVSPLALAKANRLWNPNLLHAGQRLVLPGTNSYLPPKQPLHRAAVYLVHRGDTLYSIAARLRVSARKLASANRIRNPNLIYAGQRLRLP